MSRTVILLASLAIMVLGLWGSAVIYLDEDRLKGIVAEHMAQQTGRKLEIRGALKVRFFPRLHLRAENVVVSAPSGFDGPDLIEADHLSMSVRMLPLIRGNVSAGEVSISGATVNLHTNAEGESTFDGFGAAARTRGNESPRDLLATRQMRLEDIRLIVTDVATDHREAILIEWVELDRFSFDRRLDFRFRGNVGDPPLFEEMQVEGLLNVPSTRERPIRLSNMALRGRLAGTGKDLSLLGNFSFSATPPLKLSLDDGRLEIDGQAFALEGSYDGRDRGHLILQAAGSHLAWPMLPATDDPEGRRLLPFMRAMDLDVALDFDRARLGRLGLDNLQAVIRGREGLVELREMEALIPGGLLQADGLVNARYEAPRGEFNAQLEIADATQLLETLGTPSVVSGSGSSSFELVFASGNEGWQIAQSAGRFELWDGRWNLVGAGKAAPLEFNRFAGEFRLMPGHFDLPEITLESVEADAMGWAAIDLTDHSVGGKLIVVGDGREIELFGSLADPQLSQPLVAEFEEGAQANLQRNLDQVNRSAVLYSR